MKKTALLLACLLALITALSACGGSKQEPIEAKPTTPATPLEEDPEPVAAEDPDTLTFTVEQFTEFLNNSSGMWEFAQRFFADRIVYRGEGGKYYIVPVDETLPKSDYDWTNLAEIGIGSREVEYRTEGETVSIKGIDVSRYQGEIDWEKVAADGVRFAFIRLGYRGYETGKMVVDPMFEANVEGALKNGVAVGVYFVTQAVSEEEGREEARFVAEVCAPYKITWPVVLDLEDAGGAARTDLLTSAERTDAIIGFCEEIKTLGYKPMLYSNIRWFVEKMDLSRLTEYGKWFAQYFNRPFFPYEFQIWQYTSSGRVDGIKGNVDLDISFVDYGKEAE